MTFNDVELNYILEALVHFNETRLPHVRSTDRAVYIAEVVEGVMGKIAAHFDREEAEQEADIEARANIIVESDLLRG